MVVKKIIEKYNQMLFTYTFYVRSWMDKLQDLQKTMSQALSPDEEKDASFDAKDATSSPKVATLEEKVATLKKITKCQARCDKEW